MAETLLDFQKALYDTLSGDSNLNAAVSGVFNHVPQGTEFPYIVLDIQSSKDWSTVSTIGYEVECNVAVYSRHRGSKEVLEIGAMVHAILHNADMTIENGHILVDLRYKEGNLKTGQDGLTHQGNNLFLAFIQE